MDGLLGLENMSAMDPRRRRFSAWGTEMGEVGSLDIVKRRGLNREQEYRRTSRPSHIIEDLTIEIKVTRMISALGRVGRVERCGTMVGGVDLRTRQD